MAGPRIHQLEVRLVRRSQALPPRFELLDALRVPFVWDDEEGLWRSVPAAFVAIAGRTGEAGEPFRGLPILAEGRIYRRALRVPGAPDDDVRSLAARLRTLVVEVPFEEWACGNCRRNLTRAPKRCRRCSATTLGCRSCQSATRAAQRPCPAHLADVPPAVLYRTRIPEVARGRDFFIFGLEHEWRGAARSSDPAHNDRDLAPAPSAPTRRWWTPFAPSAPDLTPAAAPDPARSGIRAALAALTPLDGLDLAAELLRVEGYDDALAARLERFARSRTSLLGPDRPSAAAPLEPDATTLPAELVAPLRAFARIAAGLAGEGAAVRRLAELGREAGPLADALVALPAPASDPVLVGARTALMVRARYGVELDLGEGVDPTRALGSGARAALVGGLERYRRLGLDLAGAGALRSIRVVAALPASENRDGTVGAVYEPADGSITFPEGVLAGAGEAAEFRLDARAYLFLHELAHAADFALHAQSRPWSNFLTMPGAGAGLREELESEDEFERDEAWTAIRALERDLGRARLRVWRDAVDAATEPDPVVAARKRAWARMLAADTAQKEELWGRDDADEERPPTSYGAENSLEDFADSLVMYLVDPGRLERVAPERHRYLAALLGGPARAEAAA